MSLPSKGLLYSEDNPLSLKVQVEIKYMTAKEEDILTNQNFIQKGIVIDKLLQSLIVSDINYSDLLIGDKNAIMIAARILSYGSKYEFEYDGVTQNVDLSSLDILPLNEELSKATSNEFSFTLPHSGNKVTFKLLTHGDERKIDQEISGLKKLNKDTTNEVTVRLSHIITSVNGLVEPKEVREFVNNYFLAKDARAFRKYYQTLSPDVNMKVTVVDQEDREEEVDVPIGINFFWPDA